ncbi:hypothetical protein Tco_1581548 [Tanacetum coccineum]
MGNRRWNLPDKHGFVIRSKRVPGYDDKDIEGTAGYWCVNGFSEVTDEGGTVIGNKTSYTLVFGDKYHDNSGRNYGRVLVSHSRCSHLLKAKLHWDGNGDGDGDGYGYRETATS